MRGTKRLPKRMRVLIAGNHRLMRAGFRILLETIPRIEVVGEAGDGREALELIRKRRPHVVIVGLGLSKLNGFEVIARVSKEFPQVKAILASLHAGKEYVAQALLAGASGYLAKDAAPGELKLAIETAISGGTYLSRDISRRAVNTYVKRIGGKGDPLMWLTPRQREIVQLIAEGDNTKEIAFRLGVSVKTVEAHRKQLMNRLDIHDVVGLVRYAMRFGLVPSETQGAQSANWGRSPAPKVFPNGQASGR
jgi:DNA-binding NarL/FixJ family response regulator